MANKEQLNTIMQNVCEQLPMVTAMPVWAKPRWMGFHNCLDLLIQELSKSDSVQIASGIPILGSREIQALRAIVDNEKEPMLYRSHSSFYLFYIDRSVDPDRSHLDRALSLCKSASKAERRRLVEDLDPSTFDGSMESSFQGMAVSVGHLLDSLRKRIDTEISYISNPLGFITEVLKSSAKETGSQFELSMEAVMMALGSGMTSTTPCAALGVTSSLIEKVRALPEKELTILIFRDDFDINDPESINFRVFTVDTFRIEKRKKKQVFEQMKATISPSSESIQKLIVGTFASACLAPFVFIPGTGGGRSKQIPFRPSAVLLEDTAEANHPQVRVFLQMMGCTNISKVDAYTADLAQRLKTEVQMDSCKYMFSKKDCEFPLLKAQSRGYECFNCNMVRPDIKQCTCKKVYFCNKKCQKAKWAQHKEEHNKAMAKLT